MGITPTYVGTCHISQFPRFRRTMVVISSHVVSDVYLGMLLASIAGVLMVSECSESSDGSTWKWSAQGAVPQLPRLADLGKTLNSTDWDRMCSCEALQAGLDPLPGGDGACAYYDAFVRPWL